LAISYSGETAELNLLVNSLKNRSVSIISMTGNQHSTLAKLGDAVLNIAVPKEACPLGLAPTASTTACLAMGDALAVVLLERKQFQESDFRRNHPGGSLGERLKVNVSEVMLTGGHIPVVKKDTPLKETVEILNDKNLGAVLIVDDLHRVAGIITDGDVRRMAAKSVDLAGQTAGEHMTLAPKTITTDLLAADALSVMQDHEITILPVTEDDGRLAGILHLHDLLGKGEFRFLV
jgi:arabinose-5-phosphate isomerase